MSNDIVDVPTGSIPAWAGEPSALLPFSQIYGVYPRVGGGTDFSPFLLAHSNGLSPRGRGNLNL